MPIYEFVCLECGRHFDHKMTLAAISGRLFILRCPKCETMAECKRVWTPPNIRAKKK